MTDIHISEDDVYEKLCSLDISNPDGWHPRFFKEAALEFAKPLSVLFRNFLVTYFSFTASPIHWMATFLSPLTPLIDTYVHNQRRLLQV